MSSKPSSRRMKSPEVYCHVCKKQLIRIEYESGALEKIDAMRVRRSCPTEECRSQLKKIPPQSGFPPRIPEKQDPFLDWFNFRRLA